MSLYLKYRPQDFNNLVGQTFVKETLKKAIENQKTVGAYLLCGPRGTGKTSTARILAKTVNCTNPNEGNPCLECSICTDFIQEKLVDIIEIDAASHTGVDNIREIIERAQFSPTQTKYKIYIIDEVHMLSKGAFNALLKILEEPPKHVKFILATTETHKVPETIISRCQRYDFKRISEVDIKNRLGFIAKSENVTTDEKAIEYIIKNSSGGLRNAISLFEQLISGSEVNYDKIVEQLEIVDENVIEEFLNKLVKKDPRIIDIFDKTIDDGKNIKLFFKELMFFTKNKSLEKLKKGESITSYLNILEILDDTFSKTKNSLDENTTFLIGVLKILQNSTSISNPTSLNNKIVQNQANQTKSTSGIASLAQEKETINQKNEQKNEISHDDINDIFGESKPEKKAEEVINNDIGNTNFDITTFITKLKSNGAKGGLTMAIRGCNISLNGSMLSIGAKTKIAKGQLENVDNASIISKSLSDMGVLDPQITLN